MNAQTMNAQAPILGYFLKGILSKSLQNSPEAPFLMYFLKAATMNAPTMNVAGWPDCRGGRGSGTILKTMNAEAYERGNYERGWLAIL